MQFAQDTTQITFRIVYFPQGKGHKTEKKFADTISLSFRHFFSAAAAITEIPTVVNSQVWGEISLIK